jgi:hypothetical protein
MKHITLDKQDPFFVTGCKEAFAPYGVEVSNEGRLDMKRGVDGEIAPVIIAGDQTVYNNYIDIEYVENDFGNMMNLFDMLRAPELHTNDDFERVFQISIDYVMPNPVVTKKKNLFR